MKIRRAERADKDAVIGLLQEFPSEGASCPDWATMGDAFLRLAEDRDRCSIFVAEEDAVLLGLITLSYPEAVRCCGVYSCIEECIVASRGRGRGIGGRLLETALDEARSRGCYELQVNNPSEAGYPLYIRHGIKDIGKHLKIILASES